MFIKQLSVFVENSAGSLQNIVDALSENGVNIRALSLADNTDFGILRLIVDEEEKAVSVLRSIGVISKVSEVIAVAIDDRAGGLANVTRLIAQAGVDLEYSYAFLGRKEGKALLVIKASDEAMAERVLRENGAILVSEEELK